MDKLEMIDLDFLLAMSIQTEEMICSLLAEQKKLTEGIEKQIAFRDWGVRPGVIVVSRSGQRRRVVSVSPPGKFRKGLKPWVYSVPEEKNGTMCISPRIMFDCWTLAETE